MLDVLILAAALAGALFLALSRRLGASRTWAGLLTPLASIMGSGFLVSAPLLAGVAGNLAIVCMAVLLVLAFAVGGAIRFNIRHFEPIEEQGHGPAQDISFLSRLVLAGAYFISVTYYLQLLAVFALQALGLHDPIAAHAITTTLLLVIAAVGMWRGLDELGALEKYTVSLNLGMVGALLLALAVYNGLRLLGGTWTLPDISSQIDGHDLRVILGLLIVVQGFETSRYLGDEFSAERRIATMRLAQIVSSVIYLVFIALVTVLLRPGLGGDVTAIIDMTRPVAIVLPLLLAVAAIGSQFSAAVADSSGAGGLLEDITQHRLPVRYAYLLLLTITITLTWMTDVNGIIAYASRAFALYYALQCVVAFVVALQVEDPGRRRLRLAGFAFLALLCLLVFALGLPAE
ncbi:MAG: hypothetical protein ACC662_05220 [Planctomycetota bacterium]